MSTLGGAVTPSPPPSPKRGRYLNYFNVVCGIVTLASFAFGIYWYVQSKQERAPAYYVSPTRARIVDTSVPAPPQLQVLYKGKDLNANLSAVIVYFWNNGKLPIKAEDVLEPMKIELDPLCGIIDARILKVSRAVTGFGKGEISDTMKNELPLSFRILEHNDGAAIQIIFSGKPDTSVSLKGVVMGAKAPRLIRTEDQTLEREPQKILRAEKIVGLIMYFFGSNVDQLAGFPVGFPQALPRSGRDRRDFCGPA